MTPLILKNRNLSISPSKMKPAVDLIRNKNLSQSLLVLFASPRKSGKMLYKIVNNAFNQIKNNYFLEDSKEFNKEDFYIEYISINKGFIRKKNTTRAKGRSNVLRRHYSNLIIRINSSLDCKIIGSLRKEEKNVSVS